MNSLFNFSSLSFRENRFVFKDGGPENFPKQPELKIEEKKPEPPSAEQVEKKAGQVERSIGQLEGALSASTKNNPDLQKLQSEVQAAAENKAEEIQTHQKLEKGAKESQ